MLKKRFLLAQNFEPKKISKPNFAAAKKKSVLELYMMIYFFTSLCEQNLILMMEIAEWKFTCVSDTLLLLLQQWEARRMMTKLQSENPSKETTLRNFFCPLSHATKQTRRRAVQQSLALFLSPILFDSTYTSAFFFLLLLFACGVICVSIPKQRSELF